MKAILTLVLVLTYGASALANTEINDKLHIFKMDTVLDCGINSTNTTTQVEASSKTGIVRLYKHQNTRVKKELTFTTKRQSAKLA